MDWAKIWKSGFVQNFVMLIPGNSSESDASGESDNCSEYGEYGQSCESCDCGEFDAFDEFCESADSCATVDLGESVCWFGIILWFWWVWWL